MLIMTVKLRLAVCEALAIMRSLYEQLDSHYAT